MARSFSWGAKHIASTPYSPCRGRYTVHYLRMRAGDLVISKANKRRLRNNGTYVSCPGEILGFWIPWDTPAIYLSRHGDRVRLMVNGQIVVGSAFSWAVPKKNKSEKAHKKGVQPSTT